ncbi:MAG: hypothetical protein AAGM38_05885, partial [Pseudomonadota bacterium]
HIFDHRAKDAAQRLITQPLRLRAGIFSFEDACALEILRREVEATRSAYPELEPQRLRYEALRRVFGAMVEDVIAESRRRLEAAAPQSPEAVRAAPRPMIGFSDEMLALIAPLRQFLFTRMYRHARVNRMMSKARRVMREMYELLTAEPNLLPGDWRIAAESAPDAAHRARLVADYIAGMTDRYAIEEHRKLFDPSVDG